MTLRTRLILIALLAGSLQSCVYYNTFYNAKKKFAQANEQRHESEADPENHILANAYLDYYLAAIKKASTVLELHSTSKWVDDSLLLIGQSYYWRGEHKEALLKFDEILDNFPDSELRNEARYWKGLALWGNEDIAQSREELGSLGDTNDRFFASQARLALAELEYAEENYETAVQNYLSLVDVVDDGELQTRLWKGLGDTYFALASYENAYNAYRKTIASGPDDLTSYQTQLQIGATQELQNDLDGARKTYVKLEGTKRFRRYQPKIQLRVANVYRLTGDIDGALEAYDDIIKRNPRTETSAEAYYQIALIEHEVRRNNEAALELFAKARKERSTSEAAMRAREMETTLFQLDRFKKRAVKDTKQGNEALFSVAEIYLFSLGEVDSAMSAYEQVIARKDSSFTPKALYGMALIHADSLGNQDEANRLFSQLVEEYPVTPYAVDARRRIGQDRSDDVLAEARYIEAEALKQEGASPEDVVGILQQVTDEYPNSLYAPKALFALAWAFENDLEDADSATDHYQRLIDKYPLTDLADISKEKLKQIKKEQREAKRKAEREAKEAEREAKEAKAAAEREKKEAEALAKVSEEQQETAESGGQAVTPASPAEKQPAEPPPIPETGPLEAHQIEQLPSLVFAPPPPEAEEVGEDEVNPRVDVRLLVDKTGKVSRVVIVNGDDLLSEQASDVGFQYKFEPGMHKGKPREVWMEFPIVFIRPAGSEDGGEGEPR